MDEWDQEQLEKVTINPLYGLHGGGLDASCVEGDEEVAGPVLGCISIYAKAPLLNHASQNDAHIRHKLLHVAPLLQVIADKHAKEKTNATDIICKFFLDAVEKKQYGWCDAPHTHGVVASLILQAFRTVH